MKAALTSFQCDARKTSQAFTYARIHVQTRLLSQYFTFSLFVLSTNSTHQAGEEIEQKSFLCQYQLLWKSPEFLRQNSKPRSFSETTTPGISRMMSAASFEGKMTQQGASVPTGSQKEDVYSFALILYEILGREGPWGLKRMNSKDVTCKLTLKVYLKLRALAALKFFFLYSCMELKACLPTCP